MRASSVSIIMGYSFLGPGETSGVPCLFGKSSRGVCEVFDGRSKEPGNGLPGEDGNHNRKSKIENHSAHLVNTHVVGKRQRQVVLTFSERDGPPANSELDDLLSDKAEVVA